MCVCVCAYVRVCVCVRAVFVHSYFVTWVDHYAIYTFYVCLKFLLNHVHVLCVIKPVKINCVRVQKLPSLCFHNYQLCFAR